MTNQQVIGLVVADPLVRQRQSKLVKGVMVEPSAVSLMGIAEAELQAELNHLLDRELIRRSLLERDYELTLSDGTEVTQGYWFEMPNYMAAIVNITMGSGLRPLDGMKSRKAFDKWWYKYVGESATTEVAQYWVEWGKSSDGDIKILLSPGVGDDDTANIHYLQKIHQPVQISMLPDDVHDLVSLGVKNRMSGGMLQASYNDRLMNVERRLEPMIGGSDQMPHSKEFENFCHDMTGIVEG